MTDAEEYLMMDKQVRILRAALRDIANGGLNPFRLRKIARIGLKQSQDVEYHVYIKGLIQMEQGFVWRSETGERTREDRNG